MAEDEETAHPPADAPVQPPSGRTSSRNSSVYRKERPKTTGSTARRRGERNVRDIAMEFAKGALDEKADYMQKGLAYVRKVESARQRRQSRLPTARTTVTTPKTLAYAKDDLVRASTPKWKHTWDNFDPREIMGSSQQLSTASMSCLQQDMEYFNRELTAKLREKEDKKRKEMERQKLAMNKATEAAQKERNVMEKVYNTRDKEVQGRAMFQIQQEHKNREYREKLDRERAEAVEQKRAEREAKLEAARKRQQEIDSATMQRKMSLSFQAESRRRALVGKHRVERAFEEKIERNRAHSARMRNRIENCQQEFAEYCAKKHSDILAGLDRCCKKRDALVEQRLEHVRSSNTTRMDRSAAVLAGVLKAEEAYCMRMLQKFMKNDKLLEEMKSTRREQYKKWLDATRAEIYDHFVRKEMLIDTLNTKKIREDFMAMWLGSYPIKERRPVELKALAETG